MTPPHGGKGTVLLGALRSIEEAGMADKHPYMRVGCNTRGSATTPNQPNFVVGGSAFLGGLAAVHPGGAVAIANGVTPPNLTPSPQIMLTKDNVDQYYEGTSVILLPAFVDDNRYLSDTDVFPSLDSMPADS